MRKMIIPFLNYIERVLKIESGSMECGADSLIIVEISKNFVFEFLERDVAYCSDYHSVGRVVAVQETTQVVTCVTVYQLCCS